MGSKQFLTKKKLLWCLKKKQLSNPPSPPCFFFLQWTLIIVLFCLIFFLLLICKKLFTTLTDVLWEMYFVFTYISPYIRLFIYFYKNKFKKRQKMIYCYIIIFFKRRKYDVFYFLKLNGRSLKVVSEKKITT